MQNLLIRQTAKQNGVKLWQIAERFGLNDGNFSRKLRRELPKEDQQRIMLIISEIAEEESDDDSHAILKN